MIIILFLIFLLGICLTLVLFYFGLWLNGILGCTESKMYNRILLSQQEIFLQFYLLFLIFFFFLLILVSEPLKLDTFLNNVKQFKFWQNLPTALIAFLFKELDKDSLQICICSQVICWFNPMPLFWLQEENCDLFFFSPSSIVLLLILNK